MVDGEKKDVKRTKDEFGNPFKTEKAALKARERALALCELDIPMSQKRRDIQLIKCGRNIVRRSGMESHMAPPENKIACGEIISLKYICPK